MSSNSGLEIHGLDEAEAFLRKLGRTSKQALSQTLDSLATNTQARAVKLITGELNLSNSRAKSKFTIKPSTPKTLTATVSTPSAGLSLGNFDAIQLWQNTAGKRVRAGVRVKVKKNAKVLKRGFAFKAKNGKVLVGLRHGKAKDDYKILYGPSVSQAFNTFHDPLAEHVTDEFTNVFFQELEKLT